MGYRIQKPYYGQHQILTSQYAKKDEFILLDGTDYEGLYHELPNGQTFTGATQEINSKEIIKKVLKVSEDVKSYNRIKQQSISYYKTPVTVFRIILDDDYDNGYIERFFVQKRNNPINTIMEIDYDQYSNIGPDPGNINSLLYNSIFIRWKISKLNKDIMSTLNKIEVDTANVIFPGLKKYITNYLEFSK